MGLEDTNAAMTIDLLLSGIAHGRSGGDLIVMGEAAGGPAFGGPGAQRGRSAVAGARVSLWQLAQGAVRPGCVVVERVFGRYPAQVMLAGDQQPAGELAAQGAGHRCAGGVPSGPCDGLGRILMPAAVTTAPQESVNCPARSLIRNLMPSSTLAGIHQEIARCRRAPQSYDRSPSRPAVEWRVRPHGFDGGTPRPYACIKAVGTEAADSATLPRVLRLPSVNVADLAFKSVAR